MEHIDERPFSAEYLGFCNELDLSEWLDRMQAVLTLKVLEGKYRRELRLHGYRLRQDVRFSEEFGEIGIDGWVVITDADTNIRFDFGYYTSPKGRAWAWSRFRLPTPSGIPHFVTLRRNTDGSWVPDFPHSMTNEFYDTSLQFLRAAVLVETTGAYLRN